MKRIFGYNSEAELQHGAVNEIDSRQKDMTPTLGDSVKILREGRAGPMYGFEPDE